MTRFAQSQRWVWAALGVVLLVAALALGSERFSLASMSGVARSAGFLALVALGQMFVVATGRGNVDLSVASVVTLSAFVTVTVGGGTDAGAPLALAAALCTGALVGLVNAALVVKLRIAAMIATLAMGYVLATLTLIVNRQVRGFGTAPVLKALASGRIGDVPVIFLVALAATTFAALVLARTAFGKKLSATGQNVRAAELAGVATGRIVTAAFVASGMFAALAGCLLSANVGGAFLDMGAPYLLQSVGAVVLGGSLIFGGASTALGTLLGSVLLVLIVTTMQIWRLPPGMQDVVQGVVIVAVLAVAGGRAASRRPLARLARWRFRKSLHGEGSSC